MSATITRALSTKERQRLHRERRRAFQLAAAAQIAADQERAAEQAAPAIMRTDISTPTGHIILGARVTIIAGRAFKTDPIASARYHGFTERMRMDARRLQQDASEVAEGCGVSAMDYSTHTAGGGSGEGGHRAILAQIDTRNRLLAAMTHLGAFAPSVSRVVLDCVPIAVWVEETGRTVEEGLAWLAKALERLGTFYHPPEPAEQRGKVLMIGPGRGAYSVGVGV